MTKEEQLGFSEPFTFDDEYNPICPKCGSKKVSVWAGMFCNRYTCTECGYRTHM